MSGYIKDTRCRGIQLDRIDNWEIENQIEKAGKIWRRRKERFENDIWGPKEVDQWEWKAAHNSDELYWKPIEDPQNKSKPENTIS